LSKASLSHGSEAVLKALKNQMHINVEALIHFAGLVIDDLKSSKGSVVAISSIASQAPFIGLSSYSIAKAAQDMLVKSLAQEYATNGVRFNSVLPGGINTPILDVFGDAKERVIADSSWRHALGRLGKPEEVATMITFLLSDLSTFITGQAIRVDGGVGLMGSLHDLHAKDVGLDHLERFVRMPSEEWVKTVDSDQETKAIKDEL